jgi:hypothetical protein
MLLEDDSVMMKIYGWLIAALVGVALALPVSAGAQEPPKKPEPAKAAPAAPAARPAPPAARAAPAAAPQRAAAPPQQRAAPQRAAAPQRQAPQRAAAPQQQAPQRAAAPQRQAPQRAAIPQQQAPSVAAPAAASRATNRAQRAAQPNQPAAAAATKQPAAAAAAKQPASAAAAVKQPAAAATVTNQPTAAQTRQQLRAERTLQQRENRAVRALPAKQRAAKQLDIQNARQLRAQQRQQQAQPNAIAAPNAAVQSNAQTRNALRRNGTAGITPLAARQGRFASRLAARQANVANASVANASTRGVRIAARRAWQRGQRAGFVPWYGPVFWPYAYSDVFDYAFWPDGYDEGYWDYAYDDFFDGMFWGEQGPPAEYAYAGPAGTTANPTASYAGVQELCTQPGSGVTAWPFADIERKVGLNAEQKSQLGQVRSAASKAAAVFKASCPAGNAFPLTPPGRLQAMTGRLDATLQAVQTVRPALEAFYDSLSDEQKERFNELGPKGTTSKVAASASETSGAAPQETDSCKQPKPGLANLPIEKIEDVVKPTDAQQADLKNLQDATDKAVGIMQAACPDETPLTPTGRLAAMQTRLQAMIDAANTVKPALASFYASLDNEQKARFNRIGEALAQSGG